MDLFSTLSARSLWPFILYRSAKIGNEMTFKEKVWILTILFNMNLINVKNCIFSLENNQKRKLSSFFWPFQDPLVAEENPEENSKNIFYLFIKQVIKNKVLYVWFSSVSFLKKIMQKKSRGGAKMVIDIWAPSNVLRND